MHEVCSMILREPLLEDDDNDDDPDNEEEDDDDDEEEEEYRDDDDEEIEQEKVGRGADGGEENSIKYKGRGREASLVVKEEDEDEEDDGELEDDEGQEEDQQQQQKQAGRDDGSEGIPVKDEGSKREAPWVVTETDSSIESPSPLEDFDALFDSVSEVVSGVTSTLISISTSREDVASPDDEEISKSLSLLKGMSNRLFPDISFILRVQLMSALQVLVQVKSLPSSHAFAIHTFSNQFETMCRSHDSNSAIYNEVRDFFNSKDMAFASLRRLNKSHVRIRSSIDVIREEKEQLRRRLKELEDSESQLLKDYTVVGKKARDVKAEWDSLIMHDSDMIEQRNKAEEENDRIETMWAGFVSLFK